MTDARSGGYTAPRAICVPQRSDGVALALQDVYEASHLPIPDDWTALLGRIEAVRQERGQVTPRR